MFSLGTFGIAFGYVIQRRGVSIRPFRAQDVPGLSEDLRPNITLREIDITHKCARDEVWHHGCILALDAVLPVHEDGRTTFIECAERHKPYWLWDVRTYHQWSSERPPSGFFPVNPIEAACLFGSSPNIGSIQAHSSHGIWDCGRLEVYHSPELGHPIGSRTTVGGEWHHATYARGIIGDPPSRKIAFASSPPNVLSQTVE